MTQLADRVRQVERLKAEQSRATINKKERVAFLDIDENGQGSDIECVEENDINVAELKHEPPYICKLLKSSNGKNPVEIEKNDKFPKRTYTFDVTKCDEIFDLLIADGQIIVPPGAKTPPLEQRKKRGFCKYHNFLGHKTSQCFLFKDLVHNTIKDDRLKFADKGKAQMQIDADPFTGGG